MFIGIENLNEAQRVAVATLVARAAKAKSDLFDTFIELEEATGKTVDLNNETIQDLVYEFDFHKPVGHENVNVDKFLNEIKDADAPTQCTDGSCSIRHEEHEAKEHM